MAKRKQVKNACTNCQRACKKCDDTRPCARCVRYGNEETCTDSARKERRRGVKRGPYKSRGLDRSTSDEASPSSKKSSSGNWTPSPDYGRPMRARRRINYREVRDGEEGREGSSGGEEYDDSQPDATLPSEPTPRKPCLHSPLFNMVLDAMHGDLVVPADHPRLSELAAVCSEMHEQESKQDPIIFTNTFEERKAYNVTPTLYVPRSVPTPPSTPVMTKPYIRPYAGAVYAPVPMQPHQKPLSAYASYFAPPV